MSSEVIKQPLQYENVRVNGINEEGPPHPPKPHPLLPRSSEPIIKLADRSSDRPSAESATDGVSKATTSSRSTAKSEHAIREAKYKLLIPVGPEKSAECAQCKELSQLLSLWELGVGGIARNCSKILAQLNQARDAHTALECRLREKEEEGEVDEPVLPTVTKSLNVSRTQKANFRKSLYDESTIAATSGSNGGGTGYVVEQMYPKKATSPGVPNSSSSECISLPYEHYLQVLNSHLGQAIDLCQQLAAACFKSNQSVTVNSGGGGSGDHLPRLRRQPTAPTVRSYSSTPKTSLPGPTPLTSYRPPLQSVTEENSPPKLHHVASFTRTSSSPGLHLADEEDLKGAESDSELQNPSRESERLANQMVLSNEIEGGWVKVNMNGSSQPNKKTSEDSKSDSNSSPPTRTSPYHNPVLTVLGVSEGKKLAKEAQKNETGSDSSELVLSSSSCASDHVRDSILSTYSDSDVKQVMSKIAGLEEERIKLLDTIDKLHKDNQLVRLSLGEILGDLESKDLQLSLAMQDLSIATNEINKAAEFRSRLARLEREKQLLTEHLSGLEDESAAVKVSLIRLLQEKSATNKTLALENWRLTQRMRGLSVRKASKGSGSGSQTTPTATSPTPATEGDNDSLVSGFSTFDEGLQEAYIGFDDAGHFVHKQGFLKKQGAKVKSWKKRLFVLNTDGLAYFKTEQPIQTVPLEKIDKVQVCHGRTIHPNMFEVHTQGRVFLLSAPSEDEMQSWVGMLQTLKQYNKVTAQAQLQAQSIAQAQAQAAVNAEIIDNSPPVHRKIVQSFEDELEPVNLPPLQGRQPLASADSAPFPYGDRLKGKDDELALLSEELADEPKMSLSVPTSPTSFGGTKADAGTNSLIESLNLQV